MNLRLILSLLPVGVFYVAHKAGPPWVAILSGFIASAIVYYYCRQDRLIGFLTLFGFLIVGVGALVGLVWQSETAYLATGPISDFLFVGIYAGSIAIGQPIIGGISRELVPALAGRLDIRHSVYVRFTLIWAAYNLATGVVRLYMLREMSVGEFLVWSRVINIPTSSLLVVLTAIAVFRAVQRDAVKCGERPPALGLRTLMNPAGAIPGTIPVEGRE